MEEKLTKLIFTLARSAKVTWGLKHKALKTIYTAAILPIILYGATVWKDNTEKILLPSQTRKNPKTD
jgi:hypothetical protein